MRQFAALVTLLTCAVFAHAQTLSAGAFQATGPTFSAAVPAGSSYLTPYVISAPQLQIYNSSAFPYKVKFLDSTGLDIGDVFVPAGAAVVATVPVNVGSIVVGNIIVMSPVSTVYLTPGFGL